MPIIIECLKHYLCYICLPIYLVVCGVQIFCSQRFKQNFIKVSHLSEKRAFTFMASQPPTDGWIITLLISLIPIKNILYLVFVFILASCETESNIIEHLANSLTFTEK